MDKTTFHIRLSHLTTYIKKKGEKQMNTFEEIIGHTNIKRYFQQAITSGKVSHSYIFEGIEGVGKKMTARAVAKMLLCQGEEKPCGECKACILVDASTHPDISFIEKDTRVTKTDTIRDELVTKMDIKPYQGPYKIMIITEADTITPQGQNAMLKTIEEPPSYGIVILITNNVDKLLPTIQSRCIHLKFNPLNQTEIKAYLDKQPISEEQKHIFAQFCEGSIGLANQLIHDEDFLNYRSESIERLQRIEEANLMQLYTHVKELVDQKEKLGQILQLWLLWYRDLALIKAGEKERLYYKDYESTLLDTSSKLTYNMICKQTDLIKNAKLQIEQNINPTLAVENLLLKLKEKK